MYEGSKLVGYAAVTKIFNPILTTSENIINWSAKIDQWRIYLDIRGRLFMKEYSYKKIQKITKAGILFKDGFELSFEECRNEWSIENKIEEKESNCVAERDALAKTPYFLFWSRDKVKVIFDKKGIFGRKKSKDEFQNLWITLNKLGFSSYDMT